MGPGLEPFKTRIPLLSFFYGELKILQKIAQKTASVAKGRQYTTCKVIQRLFKIDLYTNLAIRR